MRIFISAIYSDNCGIIELHVGYACSGVKTFLDSLVEDLDDKLSVKIEKLTSADLSSNLM